MNVVRPSGRPLRVAIVAPSLDILGGQSVCAADLASALEADGAQVTFVPVNPVFPRWLAVLRRVRGLRTILNQGLYLPSLVQLARVDVAHVFSASYWSFLLAPAPAMLVARALGRRVILHYHSGEAADHLAHWSWLVHPWLRLADEIVVPSGYLAGIFAAHGYRVRVIANTVALEAFRSVARPKRGHRLLSVRNLEAIYRVDVILEAFARVRCRYPDATLTIAGVGRLEAALRAQAAAIGSGGIRFVGRTEPSEMPRLYEQADVFLNASVVDNQPLSVLEALAAGLTVITTAPGDIANMVSHDQTGVIVPDPDPACFAAATLALFDDPDRAARLAERGRQSVDTYTWPVQRRHWLDVYLGASSVGASSVTVAEPR
jgi:glycosyltransferase involved in cell wall biosynthesis